MTNYTLSYCNYNPELYKTFPVVVDCKIYEKDTIINLDISCTNIINTIDDDIGYDNSGKYISIVIGQWHNIKTGEYIPIEEFYDLDECSVYSYDYVYVEIKIPVKGSYKSCYHNYMDRKAKISLIPSPLLEFTQKEADIKYFVSKI